MRQEPREKSIFTLYFELEFHEGSLRQSVTSVPTAPGNDP